MSSRSPVLCMDSISLWVLLTGSLADCYEDYKPRDPRPSVNYLFLTGLHFELCLGNSCTVVRRFTGSRDLLCQPFWNSQLWR
ncbi:hypothetical protein LEMLEM_LOCUS25467, partial [Lemmus lemmus]